MNVQFPEKLQFLFDPARYKVAYGGRGSGKSWSFAQALLILGMQSKIRILCCREVQKSIEDSVYRLLVDQIDAHSWRWFYEVQKTGIYGKNGTNFIFAGLSNLTVDSIKSLEGCDIAWCEEAQSISKKSWDTLIPTIRKPFSEIWVSFNPDLDTDETYVRFVENPPPDAIVRQVNYTDNPWFPDVLEKERLHCQLTNKEDYAQIWEGKCRSAVSGAIYANEITDAIEQGRICNVPYDPMLKVHTIWDLGWNDSMSIILAQKLRSEIRIIDYIEDSHKTLDWYVAELTKRNLNWGIDWLPHDGAHKDFKTGKSAQEILQAFGRKVKITPSIPVEEGVKAARMTLKQTYIDKVKAERLVECLRRYRRSINNSTLEPGSPVHDEFSHGADTYRYLAVVAEQLSNEKDRPRPKVNDWYSFDSATGVLG